jgi:hypothetical protein
VYPPCKLGRGFDPTWRELWLKQRKVRSWNGWLSSLSSSSLRFRDEKTYVVTVSSNNNKHEKNKNILTTGIETKCRVKKTENFLFGKFEEEKRVKNVTFFSNKGPEGLYAFDVKWDNAGIMLTFHFSLHAPSTASLLPFIPFQSCYSLSRAF